jgi:hypothetical protein
MQLTHMAFWALSFQVVGRTQFVLSEPPLPDEVVPPEPLPPLVPPLPLPVVPPLEADEPPLPPLLPLDEQPAVSHDTATSATHPARIFRIKASKFFSVNLISV